MKLKDETLKTLETHLKWSEGIIIFWFLPEDVDRQYLYDTMLTIYLDSRLEGDQGYNSVYESPYNIEYGPNWHTDPEGSFVWMDLCKGDTYQELKRLNNRRNLMMERKMFVHISLQDSYQKNIYGQVPCPDLWAVRGYTITPEDFI
jgi:hypothetical protein